MTRLEARGAPGSRWGEALAGDLRFALRHFARRRATVTIIVAVLALATGANTMMFSMFQTEFLRPAPGVEYDSRMARIWGQERATKTGSWTLRGFTYPEFRVLADRKDVFEDVAAYATQNVNLGGRDGTEVEGVAFVTSNYFSVLRVPLAAGKGLAAQPNDMARVDPTAVLSHALASRLFGGPAAAVGRTIIVNEVPLHVVGVAPPGFQGAARYQATSIWVPLGARATVARISSQWFMESPALQSFGRLAPGASRDDATALARRTVVSMLPDSAPRVGLSRTAEVLSMQAAPPGPNASKAIVSFVILGSVGVLILLVGWMNVSSLMVAAAVARRQEIAVRLALGASRRRILRQLLTESTLLALGAGTIGLGLAWAALTAYMKLTGEVQVSPDVGTIAFALAVSLTTGILFGLSPALHATRGAVGTAIRDSGAGSTTQSRLQRTFVTAQIALSLPLLVLLGTALWMLLTDFDAQVPPMVQRVIVVNAKTVPLDGKPGKSTEGLDSLYRRIAEHREVVAVAPQASAFDKGWVVTTPGTPNAPAAGSKNEVTLQGIAPGWLAIAELPILLGRDVALMDTAGTAAVPVVIGSNLARAVWGNANPIGQLLRAPQLLSMKDSNRVLSIVGVYDASRGVRTISASGTELTEPDGPFRVFTARGKHWKTDMILVRTRGSAATFVNELRGLMRAAAPSHPIGSVRTLEEIEAETNAQSAQGVALAAVGGVVALLIASLGLYGVISLAVQRRTREIGIRIAVGANPVAVTRMFLWSGVRIVVVALLLGLPVTLGAVRFGQAQGAMTDVPNFWLIGLGVSIALLAVATGATWRPARRAARIDPAIALRVE